MLALIGLSAALADNRPVNTSAASLSPVLSAAESLAAYANGQTDALLRGQAMLQQVATEAMKDQGGNE